ncbi:MAG: lysophospholipid acyltransferase family protein [Firmicutes bacterium]|nr:lysophospholipid acyltransferase family protein [Bacillota bacterium]
MMFYRFIWWLCNIIAFLLGGITFRNTENIPKDVSFIAAGNHRSSIDPFLIALGMKRQMAFIAKDSLFRIPIIKHLLIWVNANPIDRNGSPKVVIEKTVELLHKGKPIAIFPEGTRNKGEEPLMSFKKGAALLAIDAGVPIIPVGILNSNKTFGRKTVIYGKPIMPPAENDKNSREALTETLREEILKLLVN